MKTCLHLILLAGLLLAGTTHAQSIDDNTEPVFLHARQQITSMLAADKQPSFEEAIYQLESAWYAGGIDYVSFKTNLDLHTQNIRTLINSINSPLSATSPDIAIPPQLAKTRNKNLIANYAIYTYLTQPTLWLYDSTLTIQQPVRYSAEDPMGTADWTNTHITHLLNNGTGNCFAMAALFKILADRLGTDAQLCTAPGHIYIRHADENGTEYNVELAGRKFPGTGSIEAITYTTPEAVKNGIAMRQLDDEQAIALTLVYLAKARQYKTGRLDAYAATCAQTALQYDDKNLNAMLLKAEVMEEALLTNAAEDIQLHPLFTEYQQWLQHIYSLGYRELPQHMKEKLVKGWGKKHIDEEPVPDEEEDTRYASLSWGLFDEQVKTEAVEQYGRTLFNTATQTITGFATTSPQYNQYTYDPVIFAWEMDPMAHQMPGWSPYSVLHNSPIVMIDPLGNKDHWVEDGEGKIYWNKNVTSSNDKDLKSGETYLGKTLKFEFNSYIDSKTWDGPGGSAPAGDKLTSFIILTATENSLGELIDISSKSRVIIGETPLGTPRNYFPGLGNDQNRFTYRKSQNPSGILGNYTVNFEQHASVSEIEEMGLALLGYDIVNVAQSLKIRYSGSTLSVTAATDIFPSATLKLNGSLLFKYSQPSFENNFSRETKMDYSRGNRGTKIIHNRPAPSFYLRYKK